jgi:hypothetical protein
MPCQAIEDHPTDPWREEAGGPGHPGNQGPAGTMGAAAFHTRPLPAYFLAPSAAPPLHHGPLAAPVPINGRVLLPNESPQSQCQLRDSCTFWTAPGRAAVHSVASHPLRGSTQAGHNGRSPARPVRSTLRNPHRRPWLFHCRTASRPSPAAPRPPPPRRQEQAPRGRGERQILTGSIVHMFHTPPQLPFPVFPLAPGILVFCSLLVQVATISNSLLV